jgi:hypothetical protein
MPTKPRAPDAPPPATLGLCSACQYWGTGELGLGFGHCRFNPPSNLTVVAGQQLAAAWPVTFADDWCGSWVARP